MAPMWGAATSPLGVQTWSFDGVCSMSELPPKAEVDPPSCDVAKVPILLQKSPKKRAVVGAEL
jgi:hypothetical protein